ncbi:histidinol dehydrogenase [Corticicoccus populi]|uniref:Histidinol dehydrogenase n=1 Tax=Corticicoccus populi TaxID=1812821 RepID=A0ABW5WYS0_9STAP
MNAEEFLDTINKKENHTAVEDMQNVMNIISNVKQQGDAALKSYTKDFDRVDIENFKVPEKILDDSLNSLSGEERQALAHITGRIKEYQESIKYSDIDNDEFKYVYRPLEKVGIYIPGGTALYPSSVLMTVVPALIAGVKEIHVVTPTFNTNNMTFGALRILGVDNVYTVGGAQAVAALAYGTETIPKVDKIVGPGNKFVALAKKLVFGDVGIDMIAGPSEILLYVDDTADPAHIAYDIFAQAEHDVNARTFLLSESTDTIDRVDKEIERLIESLDRKEIVKESLQNNHYKIADTRERLIKIINEISPEHVSIQHQDSAEIISDIHYAGAVFEGTYSPEAAGDYAAGPSHVLPTDGTGRFSHGLNVNDFLTSHAVINLKKETFDEIAEDAKLLAAKEGLSAHYESLNIRTE